MHAHVLSPVFRGLFKRAICSSGTAVNTSSRKRGEQNQIAILKQMGKLFPFSIVINYAFFKEHYFSFISRISDT